MGILRNQSTKKTVIVLLLLLFLVVSMISFLSYRVATNRLKYESTSTHMALLSQIDNKMELVLQEINKESIDILGNEDVKRFFDDNLNDQESLDNTYRLNNYFARFVNAGEYVYSVDLYSYVRKRLFSGSPLNDGHITEDDDWIRPFEKFDGYSSWLPTRKLLLNESNFPIYRNVVTLVRSYPLIHSPGYRRGAVAINIKEDALYRLLTDANNRSLGSLYLLDPNGHVVSSADKKLVGQDMHQSDIMAKVLQGEREGHFQATFEHVPSSVFYVTSAYTGWKIVNIVPDVQLDQPLITVRNALMVIAVILFAVAGLMTVLVGRWTFKPLNRLIANLSKKMKAHPLYALSDWDTGNEFTNFENMVQHILSDSERLQMQIKVSKPIMKWRLLMELLTDYHANNRSVSQYMEMVGVQLYRNRFIVMSVEFDRKSEIASSRDLHLYAYALCNVAEELINAESKGAAIEWEDGQCAIILSFEDDDSGEHSLYAMAVADMLKNYIQGHFKKTVTIGIGPEVYRMEDIHLSHKQSMEALKYKLVMGPNAIITADDIPDYSAEEFHRLFAFTDNMIDSIKVLDEEKLRQQVREWFDSLASSNVRPDIIKQLVVQLLMKAAVVASDIGVPREDLAPAQKVNETLEQYESLEQIADFVTGILADFIDRIRTRRHNREKNEAIEKILRYIQKNYMSHEMSLSYLSSQFHISVSHLSKMFKDYTGGNFIDYLMEIRIGKAKEMLARGNGKIRDIAESVGYNNVNSFTRIFKKITGLTPSEYREREWDKEEEREDRAL
ncbi:helix-turn-helix domain-containing protein [Cohnella thermotolerans]|uniref:helix-turn-helix domain-containing protein n=1 Tax=Cohnella thermotolerans TaxID=329858 RepID=UPI00040F30DB|nr:helix-turn-helix domain-containing protein [Cohnella thermotolerans]